MLTLSLVAPIALLLGLQSVFGSMSPVVPVGCCLIMVAFAWVIRSSTPVSVEGMGVTITWGMLKTKRAIPWDDIERLDEGRMSARLVRRSNGKRVFFALLDPGWQERPVTIAIRRQLANRSIPQT